LLKPIALKDITQKKKRRREKEKEKCYIFRWEKQRGSGNSRVFAMARIKEKRNPLDLYWVG
jgi:hypothetical protein